MPHLEEILRDKLIPWSGNAAERIIVGRPRMRASQLPDDVQLKKRALNGNRVIIKKNRSYHNTRALAAVWPDCGLNEVKLAKLACVLTGSVDFQLGEQAVLCDAGHFIFIPSGMPHPDGTKNIVDSTKSTFCEILYFLLFPNALQCWMRRYDKVQLHRPLGNYLFVQNSLVQMFRVLMEETLSQDANPPGISEKLLQAFLQLLHCKVQSGQFQEVVSGKSNPDLLQYEQSEDFSTSLHQYIQSHLQERLTMENAARDMYLSRAQFARHVRAKTGKTFVELLHEHRIETAKNLLLNSDWTVNSIATFVGYKTPHYFQSLFLQHTGKTPGQYREWARKIETIA